MVSASVRTLYLWTGAPINEPTGEGSSVADFFNGQLLIGSEAMPHFPPSSSWTLIAKESEAYYSVGHHPLKPNDATFIGGREFAISLNFLIAHNPQSLPLLLLPQRAEGGH